MYCARAEKQDHMIINIVLHNYESFQLLYFFVLVREYWVKLEDILWKLYDRNAMKYKKMQISYMF